MISAVATLPVLSGTGKTLVPIPPVSVYAISDQGSRGTTAQRPVTPPTHTEFYDTDLQELVYYRTQRARWETFTGEARS